MTSKERFHSLPSLGFVHGRQKTRSNFLKTDRFQLLAYIKELEDRVAATKSVLHEVISSDQSTGAESSFASNKVVEHLISEKFILENSVKKVSQDRDEALRSFSAKYIADLFEREDTCESKYRVRLEKEIKKSKEFELKVQILNDRGNFLLKELKKYIDNEQKDLLIEDQKKALLGKKTGILQIISDLRTHKEMIEKESETLGTNLAEIYDEGEGLNSQLKSPFKLSIRESELYDNNPLDITKLDIREKNTSMAKCIDISESGLDFSFRDKKEDKNTSRYTYHANKLLHRLNTKGIQMHIKIEAVQSEKRSAVNLRLALNDECGFLSRSIDQDQDAIEDIPKQIFNKRKNHSRCQSNPLDYSQREKPISVLKKDDKQETLVLDFSNIPDFPSVIAEQQYAEEDSLFEELHEI